MSDFFILIYVSNSKYSVLQNAIHKIQTVQNYYLCCAMKTFEIPEFYKSPLLAKVKERRSALDQKKKDFSPTLLDFGSVRFLMARHFGFCYGVQNAIELSFRAVKENPGKRIFLLSQMIHNPEE